MGLRNYYLKEDVNRSEGIPGSFQKTEKVVYRGTPSL